VETEKEEMTFFHPAVSKGTEKILQNKKKIEEPEIPFHERLFNKTENQ